MLESSSIMFSDQDLRAEILSSILGQVVKLYDNQTPNVLSVNESIGGRISVKQQVKKELFSDEKYFDPQYDRDFTHLSDSAECMRGDKPYKRPNGWYRMALKVLGKYPNGDTWLGTKELRSHSVPGEWPVSYHGTSSDGARGIINSQYKAGDRALYGRGIYSTPDIRVAENELYAKNFQSKKTGKSYKVILQNRINPERREVCRRSDYWLIPVGEGTPAWKEEWIAERAIRPYGILIQEMKDDDEDSSDNGDDGGDCNDDGDDDGDDDDDGGDEHAGSDDGILGKVYSLFSSVLNIFG
ncbi:uncharacterized protein LOC117477714 [Trematomus bernacchii]|uniref:uncharacterized protein LOC117477714 n=1 Tax=Trematomus bernacchii TaxID=40690 RepID=UPI00146ADDD7|nr:uncharacterized protein LOC117477714 [Trematomus bernacchii]